MQKITPHLWFDTQAKEAAEFYVRVFGDVFGDSRITHSSVMHNTPSGDCDVLEFDLAGYSFMSISAGPYFKPNPAISFFVNFDPSRMENPEEKLQTLWDALSEGGEALMPLDEYPYSKKYGWVKDKYGFTWQLMLTNPDGEPRPIIIPSFLFANAVEGKTEEATEFYMSVFENSKRGVISKVPEDTEFHKKGMTMFTDFQLEGQWFAAMDSGIGHGFDFNEAVSLLVNAKDQEEIDYYWEKLSAVPEAEQCGWLKDKYGVSWQIQPQVMVDMMKNGTEEQIARVTEAFLKMKKFDVAKLEEAFKGE
jgi:predicted 3-demethylubiquinone-9 3-methyltransferase (glyoxalase superfamily)